MLDLVCYLTENAQNVVFTRILARPLFGGEGALSAVTKILAGTRHFVLQFSKTYSA